MTPTKTGWDRSQVQFSIHTGRGKLGAERLARWRKAAREVHRMDRALMQWIRDVLDAEADRVLNKNGK